MEKGYSVRETEERIRQRLQAQDQPAQARPAPSPLRLYYKEAERQLTAGLGRRVTITQGKKKGKIALEYYDQEDLEGLGSQVPDKDQFRVWDKERRREPGDADPRPDFRRGDGGRLWISTVATSSDRLAAGGT